MSEATGVGDRLVRQRVRRRPGKQSSARSSALLSRRPATPRPPCSVKWHSTPPLTTWSTARDSTCPPRSRSIRIRRRTTFTSPMAVATNSSRIACSRGTTRKLSRTDNPPTWCSDSPIFTTPRATTASTARAQAGPDTLEVPAGMTVDTSSNLYIVDSGNNRVLEYDNPFLGIHSRERAAAHSAWYSVGLGRRYHRRSSCSAPAAALPKTTATVPITPICSVIPRPSHSIRKTALSISRSATRRRCSNTTHR